MYGVNKVNMYCYSAWFVLLRLGHCSGPGAAQAGPSGSEGAAIGLRLANMKKDIKILVVYLRFGVDMADNPNFPQEPGAAQIVQGPLEEQAILSGAHTTRVSCGTPNQVGLLLLSLLQP